MTIPELVARVRSLWRSVRLHSHLDAETNEEFRLHLELRAEDLVRRGLSPEAAARQARVEFGSTAHYVDVARESRGLRQFDALRVSWLDFKLGFRMLARYPGLTLIGGLALAFAIWVGAVTFELATQIVRPTLPLPDGHRIVALKTWDAVANAAEEKVAYDVAVWRSAGGLKSVEELGAFMISKRNLITADGQSAPIDVAEISAAAFRVASVAPLIGRTLTAADERVDAPPVAVIGYDLWHSRFGGKGDVIGQTARIGNSYHTIVGVMPNGFGFPINNSFWTPLHLDFATFAPREGPRLKLFGRLAPGATLGGAQAELTALGHRSAAVNRETHAQLRPQVMPYAKSIINVSGLRAAAAMGINVPVVMLLVLIGANVALLMFARAATRETEIVVRSALGASRGRIVMQLFAEALVLGGVAALIGLGAAGIGIRLVMTAIGPEFFGASKLPFWFRASLSPTTVSYGIGLTLLSAVIAGVMPGLKVTRGVGARLKAMTAGGGGVRLGRTWTAVIVAQIAVTVVAPAITYFAHGDATKLREMHVGLPEAEYLTAQLAMTREYVNMPGARGAKLRAEGADAFVARVATTLRELERRLREDPAVQGVTFANRLPRMYHPHRLIAMDAGGAAPLNPNWPEGYRVSSASVAPNFFDVLRAPILLGRGFHAAEHDTKQHVVIVNESFVKLVLGNRNPIGRRFRYVFFEEGTPTRGDSPAAWHEIIGVVRDMAMASNSDPKVAGIYHPISLADIPPQLLIHVKGSASAFSSRLQSLALATDPTLRLQVLPMDRMADVELAALAFMSRMLLLVSAVALTLSLAGIYSVMSFAVSRRTREIGVRVALGASPLSVITAIFTRPLTQVGLGVVTGAFFLVMLSGSNLHMRNYAQILAYSVVMLLVCLIACIVPTRRALRVQPTEALKAEG